MFKPVHANPIEEYRRLREKADVHGVLIGFTIAIGILTPRLLGFYVNPETFDWTLSDLIALLLSLIASGVITRILFHRILFLIFYYKVDDIKELIVIDSKSEEKPEKKSHSKEH